MTSSGIPAIRGLDSVYGGLPPERVADSMASLRQWTINAAEAKDMTRTGTQ